MKLKQLHFRHHFISCFTPNLKIFHKSRDKGKDRESMQSIPYLMRNTNWKTGKNARKHSTQEEQEVSPFPAGDHKMARNRQDSKTIELNTANSDSFNPHQTG